jgi:A/G-specific adenine glycosylase
VRKWRVPRAAQAPLAPWNLNKRQLARFQQNLLDWFRREKRDLPWRCTRDPYRIWISEIMLQQTRVAAVLPYYARFLRQFPNVHALARARTETVLRFWAGLGYYRRARNLHNAAKQVVARHGGKFPRTLDAALDLPGIGAYTAAAILSIAYDVPLAVLDGNAARVLARLGAIRGDLRQPRRWRSIQAAADTLLAAHAPGQWNEGMMELGATVCTPRAPLCGKCPVANACRARALGIENQLPTARTKRATESVTLAAAVLIDPQSQTLLIRPSRTGTDSSAIALFSNLWQFPAAIVKKADGANTAALSAQFDGLAQHIRNAKIEKLAHARHAVTFRDVRLVPCLARVAKLPAPCGLHEKRVALASVSQLAVSSATRKIAAIAQKALSEGSR